MSLSLSLINNVRTTADCVFEALLLEVLFMISIVQCIMQKTKRSSWESRLCWKASIKAKLFVISSHMTCICTDPSLFLLYTRRRGMIDAVSIFLGSLFCCATSDLVKGWFVNNVTQHPRLMRILRKIMGYKLLHHHLEQPSFSTAFATYKFELKD